MKLWSAFIGLIIISCLISQQLQAAALRCEVNWKDGIYIVEGQAFVSNPKSKQSREKALMDARSSAISRMMSLIQKTGIKGTNSAQVLAKNPVAKRKVMGILDGARNLAYRFVTVQRKTAAIVTMKIAVFGPSGPGSIIVSAGEANQTNPKTYATELDDSHSSIIEPVASVPPPEADNESEGYTSLVLDASGCGVKKSMCPRILRTNNGIIWAGETVSIDQVEEFGIAAYCKSLEAANRNPRCGLRPLIIRAKGSAGNHRYDVVVSDEDADLILSENQKSSFLEKINVIIVTN